ncbi:MAG: hypothetical protein C0430_02145 [Flavobacterium sp.]|nr:hypothetical protein [Flavobacterium sp.]
MAKKSPNIKRAPLQTKFTELLWKQLQREVIPHAEQLPENKIAVTQMQLIFDKDFKIRHETYFH